MTLEAIAEIIENSVMGGLKGITNYTMSTEQIMDEINLTGNSMMEDLNKSGFSFPSDIYQNIPCVELECKDLSECCDLPSGEKALISKESLPRLLSLTMIKSVQYLGLIDQNTEFKFVDNFKDAIYSKFSPSGKRPLGFINNNGYLVIKNPPTSELKFVMVSGLFATPSELEKYSCICQNGEVEYRRPDWLIDKIIGKMINDYLRYYRMGSITQPNTQEQINLNSK